MADNEHVPHLAEVGGEMNGKEDCQKKEAEQKDEREDDDQKADDQKEPSPNVQPSIEDMEPEFQSIGEEVNTSSLSLKRNLAILFDEHVDEPTTTSDTTTATGKAVEPTAALRVLVRLRPVTEGTGTSTVEIQTSEDTKTTKLVTHPPTSSRAYKSHRATSTKDKRSCRYEYTFDHVYDKDIGQIQLYGHVVAPVVNELVKEQAQEPQNVAEDTKPRAAAARVVHQHILFAYGVTGSGKTHTILGSGRRQEQEGILPRAVRDIMGRLEGSGGSLQMSYLEIYKNSLYDLLQAKEDATDSFGLRQSLRLRDCNGDVTVPGLIDKKVESVDEALQLVRQAQAQRHTNSNGVNHASSRSHVVCQLRFDTRGETRQLWIVDLAGSERTKRTQGATASRSRRQEGIWINGSLMQLMKCLRSANRRSADSKVIVEYRESKLTHLLWPLLQQATTTTTMMVNIHPSEEDFDETRHVLGYAAKATKMIIPTIIPHHPPAKRARTDLYDINGRRRQPHGQASTRNFKRTLRSDGKPQHTKATRKRHHGLIHRHPHIADKSGASLSRKRPPPTASNTSNIEVQLLKTQLQMAQAEISVIKAKHADDLAELDLSIRNEVAEEMAIQLSEAQQDYESQILELQLKLDRAGTIRVQRQNKVDRQPLINRVTELEEQVAECEEEMARMRTEHEAAEEELVSLRLEAEDRLQRLQKELELMESTQGGTIELETTVTKLHEQLESTQEELEDMKATAFEHRNKVLELETKLASTAERATLAVDAKEGECHQLREQLHVLQEKFDCLTALKNPDETTTITTDGTKVSSVDDRLMDSTDTTKKDGSPESQANNNQAEAPLAENSILRSDDEGENDEEDNYTIAHDVSDQLHSVDESQNSPVLPRRMTRSHTKHDGDANSAIANNVSDQFHSVDERQNKTGDLLDTSSEQSDVDERDGSAMNSSTHIVEEGEEPAPGKEPSSESVNEMTVDLDKEEDGDEAYDSTFFNDDPSELLPLNETQKPTRSRRTTRSRAENTSSPTPSPAWLDTSNEQTDLDEHGSVEDTEAFTVNDSTMDSDSLVDSFEDDVPKTKTIDDEEWVKSANDMTIESDDEEKVDSSDASTFPNDDATDELQTVDKAQKQTPPSQRTNRSQANTAASPKHNPFGTLLDTSNEQTDVDAENVAEANAVKDSAMDKDNDEDYQDEEAAMVEDDPSEFFQPLERQKSPVVNRRMTRSRAKKPTSPKRKPFGALSSNTQADVDEDDLIIPAKRPGLKKNGEFRKPRSKAPVGREWDAKRGGWRISILPVEEK